MADLNSQALPRVQHFQAFDYLAITGNRPGYEGRDYLLQFNQRLKLGVFCPDTRHVIARVLIDLQSNADVLGVRGPTCGDDNLEEFSADVELRKVPDSGTVHVHKATKRLATTLPLNFSSVINLLLNEVLAIIIK